MTGAASFSSPILSSADTNAKLEAISATSGCAEGRVITLDFSAIKQRLGDRWRGRRDDVWPKLEAIIAQHVGRQSIWLRICECEYLVAFAEERGSAVQAIGFKAIEEGLKHFLGSFFPQELLVNRVTSIEGEVISRIAVKPSDPPLETGCRGGGLRSTAETSDLSAPFLVEDQVDALNLSCGIEDVVNLKTGATIGLRITGKYANERSSRALSIRERASLSTRVLTAMDRRVAKAIPALFSERAQAVVVAPLSLHTFGTSNARLTLFKDLNNLDADQRNRLIIELGGFEAGTPSSRLVETAAMLKPFCRYVSAQPVPSRQGLLGASNARFPSMSVSARELGADGSRLAAGLLALGQAAQGLSPKLVATDLPSETFLSVCNVAGFTLATIEREKFGAR